VTKPSSPAEPIAPKLEKAPRQSGFKLLRKLIIYHSVLAAILMLIVVQFPDFIDQLPIGGVTELVSSGDLKLAPQKAVVPVDADIKIVRTVIKAANELDRLGYARQLMMILLGLWCLMLPVSWVHKGIHQGSSHDHSLDETILILPGIVAAIVLIVQHSLALAFSLAGIVAGVRFRRALLDTFDALFILVGVGTGIAAGVEALEIAAVMTLFFTYATMYVYIYGDGLETDHIAHQKALKLHNKLHAKEEKVIEVTSGKQD
jgi:hypothetical protein